MINWQVSNGLSLTKGGVLRGMVGDIPLFTISMNPTYNPESMDLAQRLEPKYKLNPLIAAFNFKLSNDVEELKNEAETMIIILTQNLVAAGKKTLN